MHKFALSGIATALVLTLSPVANAATFTIDNQLNNNPSSGSFTTLFAEPDFSYVNATFNNLVSANSVFSDTFQFLLPKSGTGSGSLSATFLKTASIIISSVVVNSGGQSFTFLPGTGANDIQTTATGQSLNTNGVPIFGSLTDFSNIVINGTTVGSRPVGYSGNISFKAAVPEASTWALMILGIGGIGFAARRTHKATVRVAYA